jgi:hydrogenase maturation protease
METKAPKILVYGYGNPGRQDDALGIALVDEIEKWCNEKGLKNIETSQNYQLNIEDAEKISHFDQVIFADASVNITCPYSFDKVIPSLDTEFTMHSVTPSFVLGLCNHLFTKNITAYQLQIRGEKWNFMEEMTFNAADNLSSALEFLKSDLIYHKVPDKLAF